MNTVLIIILCGLVVLFLQPVIIYILSKPCYRLRKVERINRQGVLDFYYKIEQMHKFLSFVWWDTRRSGSFTTHFRNQSDAENYIKHLLSNDKETVSNVICKNSPNTKVTFD